MNYACLMWLVLVLRRLKKSPVFDSRVLLTTGNAGALLDCKVSKVSTLGEYMDREDVNKTDVIRKLYVLLLILSFVLSI
jgi:hypothetical protein